MAELIAFFSRGDENYVNGEIKNLGVGKHGGCSWHHPEADRRGSV